MTADEVLEVLCRYYSTPGQAPVTIPVLRSEERGDSLLSEARQLAYWFLVQHVGMGVAETARYLCREHPTVIHGLRAVEANIYRRNWEICTAITDIALLCAFPKTPAGRPLVAAGQPRPAQPALVSERRKAK